MRSAVLSVAAIALYAVYAAAGLQLLLFAMLESGEWKMEYYYISFVSSVACLAAANVLHCVAVFGVWRALLATLGCVCVICVFEEIGLRTGYIFGEYHFTPEMGYLLTPHLPLLVPVLWCDVLYPAYLLASCSCPCPYAAETETDVRRMVLRAVSTIATAAAALTGFDLMCEPVSTIFGHQLWHHVAFVDNGGSSMSSGGGSVYSSYINKPDWVFHRLEDKPLLFGIPLQVSDWAGVCTHSTSVYLYSCFMCVYCCYCC